MLSAMEHKLREIEEKDLELILNWRNADHIHQYMYTDHIITMDEHKKWFHHLKKDKSTRYKIFEINNQPVGLVYFVDINREKKTCNWGFYLGKKNTPKGTGVKLGYYGLNYAFNTLKLNKIYGEVFTHNTASLKFHQKLGFIKDELLENYIVKNGKGYDVVRFFLVKSKWDEIIRNDGGTNDE